MPQVKRTRTEKLLTMEEIQAVIHDLKTRLKYRDRAQRQLVLFRLATCCGLRVSEICDLRLADVDIERMDLHVRNGKGNKARTVPLNWDGSTLADLREWKQKRNADGASESDYFIATRDGGQLNRVDARESFKSACKIIGRDVTIHFGRHSYLSHALDQGRSIVEVQEAAGHSNVATTSTYLHQVRRDRTIGSLFG